jgi:hypothetical protein
VLVFYVIVLVFFLGKGLRSSLCFWEALSDTFYVKLNGHELSLSLVWNAVGGQFFSKLQGKKILNLNLAV